MGTKMLSRKKVRIINELSDEAFSLDCRVAVGAIRMPVGRPAVSRRHYA